MNGLIVVVGKGNVVSSCGEICINLWEWVCLFE